MIYGYNDLYLNNWNVHCNEQCIYYTHRVGYQLNVTFNTAFQRNLVVSRDSIVIPINTRVWWYYQLSHDCVKGKTKAGLTLSVIKKTQSSM